jgi:excisionase family DNA binding protein
MAELDPTDPTLVLLTPMEHVAFKLIAQQRQRKLERPPDGLLSAREAARSLGVSLSTFKDSVRAGLPAVEIGRRRLFDPRDLETWRNIHKVGGFDLPPATKFTASASGMLAGGTKNPRAAAILSWLVKKPRRSTPK